MAAKKKSTKKTSAALAEAVAEAREVDILKRYVERKLTRERAAALLHCSERQINRKLEERKLERKEGRRAAKDREARERREVRDHAAELAAAGKISVEQAALRAGCSERTIYRYLEKK